VSVSPRSIGARPTAERTSGDANDFRFFREVVEVIARDHRAEAVGDDAERRAGAGALGQALEAVRHFEMHRIVGGSVRGSGLVGDRIRREVDHEMSKLPPSQLPRLVEALVKQILAVLERGAPVDLLEDERGRGRIGRALVEGALDRALHGDGVARLGPADAVDEGDRDGMGHTRSIGRRLDTLEPDGRESWPRRTPDCERIERWTRWEKAGPERWRSHRGAS
jgi:hypothetical protein